MVSHKIYCVKCRGKKICDNIKMQRDKRGKPRMCGVCRACGIKCYQYISQQMAMGMKSPRKSKSRSRKSKSRSRSRSRR